MSAMEETPRRARTAEELDALLRCLADEARALGIPVSPELDGHVRINRRAKTRFGCCRRADGRYVIELSWRLLSAAEGAVRRVLAHEVLHTCPGCANHGPRWKEYAARMNRAYGYGIARTDSFEALGLIDERQARYVVRCTQCGRELRRMRRSPLVDHPERYRCSCGGRFQVL